MGDRDVVCQLWGEGIDEAVSFERWFPTGDRSFVVLGRRPEAQAEHQVGLRSYETARKTSACSRSPGGGVNPSGRSPLSARKNGQ